MKELSNEILKRLRDKALQLISLYEKTKVENVQLLDEKQMLIEEIKHQRERIELLEDKNKRLQLAEAFKVSSVDTDDAKLKIGKIVREIDKCIALLNK